MTDKLAGAITRHCDEFWFQSPVPRLSLVAADEAPPAVDLMYTPMICFVAAGAKRTTAGEQSWVAGAGEMFVSSLEVPITATFERLPYRSVVLQLEQQPLADLLIELGSAAEPPAGSGCSTTRPTSGRWPAGSRARSSTACSAARWPRCCGSSPWPIHT
jgi:AraC-type transcriptional regulator